MENILSIAPMVDKTDRHFRNFVRMITDKPMLYTEMITAKAILNGNVDYILGFNEIEHPITLQIAATTPEDAYEAVLKAERFNYDEININVGCPSDKVSGNMMGAYLMAFPEVVAEMVTRMKRATNKPITVKHRIGIDGKNILPDYFERTLLDQYEDMENFVKIVSSSGVNKFIVHARIAILEGLDPKQNREIPPIRYEEVYRLKKENPNLLIEINGGIKTLEDARNHLNHVDSIMIGREIYDGNVAVNPIKNKKIDSCAYCAFQAICRYDSRIPGFSERSFNGDNKEDVLDKMRTQIAAAEHKACYGDNNIKP